jgi:lysophospholipase L1-like esterase
MALALLRSFNVTYRSRPNPTLRNLVFSFLLLFLGAVGIVRADTPVPSAPTPSRPPWELEWAYLSKYHDANLKLPEVGFGKTRVVFLGDSITEAWGGKDPDFFLKNSYINRGISGQTSSQLLVRFRQDVISLKPDAVVILGGTNDIAENGGTTTLGAIEENIQSMVELAKYNHIRVVLCSVLPAFDYPWRKGLKPAEKIYALNQWIASFSSANRITFVDYYAPMVDAERGLKASLSEDGVHPNAAGYAIMEPLVKRALQHALAW